PPATDGRFTIIPYLAGGATQNFEAETDPGSVNLTGGIGADAKVAVTSSLNLDLTVNPDFSQVEVDRQVTNLDRFQLFFPERRQFFIENSDLFAQNGFSSIRPFYSRRIGLDAPVITGARLSGKPNQNWRVGLLNVQTGRVAEEDIAAKNFTVATFQRQVLARSVLSGIFVNQQATSDTFSDSP
ncbi:MAG TPA: hydrolase, partial [Cytophagales bacterium]|nr:hydrolase [Cytophagales bacterium]